ncbi:MAG: hypothetical protein WC348_04750 [Patescibacteria group bacterium]|jgi:hypothetical protein
MGQEITIQLASQGKPAVFCACDEEGGIYGHAVADAINAVRLFGYSQLLIVGGGSEVNPQWSPCSDEKSVARVREMIRVMQVKGEKIMLTITPAKPEEREQVGLCRIDLRLKK